MSHRARIGQRLAALFVLGWLLFNYPLLAVFDKAGAVFGIPLLYICLFAAWAFFICLLALALASGAETKAPPKD